ncbi:MAG TPA: universal stress protein, partial [Phycisphaerae bacterium]
MYPTILVTLDGTPTDRAIIEHIKRLAKLLGSRVVLLHVATSVPAQFHGAEAAGEEVEESQSYLNAVRAEFEALAIPCEPVLVYGSEPVKEIVKWIEAHGCDLVAMSTHGHKFVADLVLGTTASRVQHSISVPVLL